MRAHLAGRQRARLRGQEADRERLRERGGRELVGNRLAEREAERHLDEVDADGVAHEVGHLPAGDARRDLDDTHRAVVVDEQLREGDAVASPSARTACAATCSAALERVAVDRRRVDVDPADAEADAGRAQPVGERERRDLAVARDGDAVQLERVVEALDDRLALGRLGQRGVQVRVEVVLRARAGRRRAARRESAGFSTAGKPTVSPAARALARSRAAAKRGCGTPASASVRRIAILCVIRCAVSVPMPGRPSDSATAATTGTARSAETVEHAVDAVPPRDLGDRRDVGEVDRLGDVRLAQPERVGIAVDCDDAQPELLRPQDRPALVAAGADEEDRGARYEPPALRSGKRNACRLQRSISQPLRAGERRPDAAAAGTCR